MEVVRTQQKAVDLIAELYFDALESTKGKSAEGDAGGIKFSPRLSPDFASKVDIESNYKSVADMQPVAQIKGTEFAKGDTDLVTQVSNFFESIGGEAVNPELGTIKLTRTGVKSDIAHGIGRNKAAAFAAVPAVIEHGKIVDVQYNWKGRGYDTVVIASPITLANELYYVGAVLEKTNTEDTFYLHEVIAESASAFKNGSGIKARSTVTDAPSVVNILQKISNYKQSSKNVKQSSKNSAEQTATTQKEAQFTVIQNSNAAQDDYHTWIRSADEIKTLEETLTDPEWSEYTEYDPDYTRQMAEEAVQSGNITVYSSNKIGNGVFVSPSKMEAESYSASGKVYSKTVNINDIAWIDPTQGQYAPIDSTVDTNTNPDIRFSRKDGTPATEKDVQELQKRNDSLKKQLAKRPSEVRNIRLKRHCLANHFVTRASSCLRYGFALVPCAWHKHCSF